MKWISILVLFFSFYIPSSNAKKVKTELAPTKINSVTKEMKFNYTNFKEAKNENNFLKFVGKSTKFKVFTTEFEGYAKIFTVTYEQNENVIKNISISISARALDTDSDSRNEKMWKKCLDVEKFPNVSATTKDSIELVNEKTGEMEIELSIKDKKLNRKLKYSVIKATESSSPEVIFSTDFSFIEAGIEDPSILIAKVGEIFQIQGKITIK